MTTQDKARYVWIDEAGHQRDLHGYFRRRIQVSGEIEDAQLHVYADTIYQLFVNGTLVGYGPVRNDPRFPQYDTWDLRPHLHHGENVIALHVTHWGCKVYRAIPRQAALIGWGTVKSLAGSEDLTTGSGNWRCARADAWMRYTGKISFALNPACCYEQGLDQPGWKEPNFDDAAWGVPPVVADLNQWGKLEPRSIPHMSLAEVQPESLRYVLPLAQNEERYSFTVPVPHKYDDNKNDYSDFVAFQTWVWAPEDMDVPVGVFWGEHWINGDEINGGVDSVNKVLRIQERWPLRKGWNHFFGKVGAYHDILDAYFAFPAGRGIVVSADKDPSTGVLFRRSPVLSAEEFQTHLADKALPYPADEDLAAIGGWVECTANDQAESPCREAGMDDFAEAEERLGVDELEGHVFPLKLYPHGFSLMLDLGHMHLILPRLRLSGVAGAKVDITFSEHLTADGLRLNHSHALLIGDRALCSDDRLDWMPNDPRGGRYIRLTVREMQGDVTIDNITLRSGRYPAKQVGAFRCSDRALSRIWEMGALTQIADMEDAYVDCSGRERGMYGRDTIIQYANNLALYGDQALMGRCMQLYGQSPDATGKFRAVYPNTGSYTIADFALNMVEGYKLYHDHSGDDARIRQDWDAIINNLAWFDELADEREDKLLDSEWDTHRGVFSNYGGFHGDGGISRDEMAKTGVHCAFSCTYLSALRCASHLGNIIGKDVAAIDARIAVLEKSIPAMFWDAEAQCYADNDKRSTYSPHASLHAVLAGVASDDQLPGIRRHVRRKLRSLFVNGYDPSEGVMVSPHYAFYVFNGLYRIGLADVAQNLMRQGWGWMLSNGAKTCYEFFGVTPGFSLCHAWSASPTYYLSKHVLGVHYPDAGNLDVIELRVQAPDIDWAEGTWPHPRGPLHLRWHREEDHAVFDQIEAPAGVSVTVANA